METQNLLFEPNRETLSTTPRAASRATDPQSSKQAAADVERCGAASDQRLRVLELVRNYPGRTSKELGDVPGPLDRFQIARRLPELEAVKLVRREQRGTQQCRWYVVEARE